MIGYSDEAVERAAKAVWMKHRVYGGYNTETKERKWMFEKPGYLGQLRDFLSTLPPLPTEGWRDIATAPRPGATNWRLFEPTIYKSGPDVILMFHTPLQANVAYEAIEQEVGDACVDPPTAQGGEGS